MSKEVIKILKATHQGELELNGFKISSAVLSDGTRVLVNRSLANAFGIKGSGAYWQKKKEGKEKGALLPEYLSAKYLTPFISDELMIKLSKPIPYINAQGLETEGIPAELMPGIVYLLGKPGKEWLAGLICPCGCKNIIELPLIGQNPKWSIFFSKANKVSFSPSIWRNVGCKSHFFIQEATVRWC